MTLIDVTRNIGTRPPEHCPWCGHQISRAKFLEIEGKIRDQELKKAEEAEGRLKEQFERQLAAEKQAAEKRATELATKQLTAITAERDEAVKKAQEAKG